MDKLSAIIRNKFRAVRHRTRRLARIGADDPVILMYHRIARPPYDPWGLAVSPEIFAEQLAALKRHRTMLSMDELVESLDRGGAPLRAAAVTFDDGYADNYTVAKPLLEEHRIPATMFVTTAFVGSAQPFWWDELAELVLAGHAGADLDLHISGATLQARWDEQPEPPASLAGWRFADPTDDPRRLAYRRLWRAMQPLAPAEREQAIGVLRSELASDADGSADTPLPMTAGQVRTAPSAMISLGGHGRSHSPLPILETEARRAEIVGGRDDLQRLSRGIAPTGFAYPHGEWDDETREQVRAAGYNWAVTTREAKINPRRYERFALPRLAVTGWSGSALLQRVSNGIGH